MHTLGHQHGHRSPGYTLRSVGSTLAAVAAAAALLGVPFTSAAAGGQVDYTVFTPSPLPASQPTQGAASLVSLSVTDSTLEYAIREVARQAHLRVGYHSGQAILHKRVSVHVVKMEAMEALAVILKGSGLAAKLTPDGEAVLIGPRSESTERGKSQGMLGVVVGRVTDSTTGAALSGAQVRVEGTKLATLSSDSGRFTLNNVPPGDQVLLVRLFGYRPATHTVTVVDGERTTVRIAMASVPTVLSGVVTTATGLQRKVEVGNDITTLNVDSIMQVAPITSMTDLLETRVPGLTVLHTSGDPGSPSRIRLRGAGSITGNNDPIVVVDGARVYASQSDGRNTNLAAGSGNTGLTTFQQGEGYAAPSPLDQIDPGSIETIEVFKGPSASALYGSDAASGVIVVTTKHGRAGPTHWSTDLGAGMNYEPGNWPVNYYRFGASIFDRQNPICAWNDLSCTTDSVVPFQALNDPNYTVFSHGHNQTASLTVSGGVPTLQYSLTGSAAGNVGLLKLPGLEQRRYAMFYGPVPGWLVRPDNYQTWGMSGQLTAQPSTTARVTLTSSLFNSAQQTSSLQGGILQLEGEYVFPDTVVSTPLLQNELQRATAKTLTSTNALTVTWQPYAWLPLSATGGLNTIQRTDETLIPYGVNNQNFGNLTNLEPQDTTGQYGLGRGTSQDKTLTVGTAIRTRAVTFAVGANLANESTADVTAFTNQLAPGVTEPTSFPTTGDNVFSTFSQATTAWSTYGWYVEPRLNLSSKFFVAPGFRLDGGSASGANAGLTGFPKIDLSYIAVDQSHPRGILTLFRPRLAFGYAGTQPGPTERLRLLNIGGVNTVDPLNDSTIVPVLQVSTLGNTQLRPERSSEVEGGFDAELWHGRASLTYTQYNKTRHDAIISIPVATSVIDAQQFFKNIGVVRNTGTELTATATVLQSRALSWTVGGNVSNNNNLVVRLNPGVSTIVIGDGTRVEAGYPLFGRWALPIVSFADVNHNGIIEPNEVRYGDSAVFVGQEEPKYQVNFNTGVTLLNGRLSATATFTYQNGLTQFNAGALSSQMFALLPNTPGTSLATQAAVIAASGTNIGLQNQENHSSSIGLIQTVNTFRFNDLSINYAIPPALSTWFRVPRMTIALQGSNLGLHTNYRGKDPNVNAFSTALGGDQTADFGQIPQPRTWWLKVSLSN